MIATVEKRQQVDHARRAAAELGKVALNEVANRHCPLVSYMYIYRIVFALFNIVLSPTHMQLPPRNDVVNKVKFLEPISKMW